MLSNQLILNGTVDAYTVFGVYLYEGNYPAIVQMPPLKQVDTVSYHEVDGMDADLDNPVLDGNRLTLKLNITSPARAQEFLDYITTQSYSTWNFVRINRTMQLRLVSCADFTATQRFGFISINLANDFPPQLEADTYPVVSGVIPTQRVRMDDIDLSRYGVWVLQGTDTSVRKWASVRENLKRDLSTVSGIEYDNSTVYFNSKDFTVSMLIHSATVSDFWKRYNSLFADIISPDARVLEFDRANIKYQCYYKSSAAKKVLIQNGEVWCEFSITFTALAWEPIQTSTDQSFDLSFDNSFANI